MAPYGDVSSYSSGPSFDFSRPAKPLPKLPGPYARSSFESITPAEARFYIHSELTGHSSKLTKLKAKFKHQPLTPGASRIRLVKLLPTDKPAKPVQCQLIEVELEHASNYKALSYEWGSDTAANATNAPIKLDGRDFLIRKTLRTILEQLRLPFESRLLWIDAICINQESHEERTEQVAKMGEIYSRSDQVISWVGVEDEQHIPSSERPKGGGHYSGAEAMDFLHYLCSQSEETSNRYMERLKVAQDEDTPYELAHADLKQHDIQLRKFNALIALTERSYWTRLWVVPEFIMAPSVMVHCGNRTLNPMLLLDQRARTAMRRFGDDLVDNLDSSPAMTLVGIRANQGPRFLQECQENNLLDLMFAFRSSRCKDIRDKVFGLRSMAPMCCQSAIKVDYECNPVDLCQSVVKHIISNCQYQANEMDGLAVPRIALDSMGIGKFHGTGKQKEEQAVKLKKYLDENKANNIPRMTRGAESFGQALLPVKGQIVWAHGFGDRTRNKRESLSRNPHFTGSSSHLPSMNYGANDLAEEDIQALLNIAMIWLRSWQNRLDAPPMTRASKTMSLLTLGIQKPRPHDEAPRQLVGIDAADFFMKDSDFTEKITQSRAHVREEVPFAAEEMKELDELQLTFFITDENRVGFGTKGIQVGDVVCGVSVLEGGHRVAIVDVETTNRPTVVGKGLLMPDGSENDAASRLLVEFDMATIFYLSGYF